MREIGVSTVGVRDLKIHSFKVANLCSHLLHVLGLPSRLRQWKPLYEKIDNSVYWCMEWHGTEKLRRSRVIGMRVERMW